MKQQVWPWVILDWRLSEESQDNNHFGIAVKSLQLHNREEYNYRHLRNGLETNHCFGTETDNETVIHLLEVPFIPLRSVSLVVETDNETVIHLLEEAYQGDLKSAATKVLPKLDGSYALAASDGKNIVVARDVVGVKQLYIGENSNYIAFTSERKALWELGISGEERLLPGQLAKLSFDGITLKSVIERGCPC